MQNPIFDNALELHRRGHLAAAHAIYVEILQKEPRNVDCLHLLGVIASQTGRHQQAVDFIDRAIAINPMNATFYSNRGNALQELKHFEAALASYDRAITLNPKLIQAFNNRGNALKALKMPAAAISSFDRAIRLKQDYPEAHCNRGVALADMGRFEDAVASYNTAIGLKPDYAEAYSNRGNAQSARRMLDAAVQSFDKAIALKPNYAEAYSNRGVVLLDQIQLDAALASFEKAIALNPDYAEAYSNRGNVLCALKRVGEAISSYDRAIVIDPFLYKAHCNRGNALRELQQFDAALSSYDHAISINAAYAEGHCCRGNALRELGQLDAAITSYDRAIGLKPDYADALINRGVVLHEQGQLGAAIANFDAAINAKPDYGEALFNKSIALLRNGDFTEGWRLYEWRFSVEKAAGAARKFSEPLWLGKESLAHKTILLHSEQGLGDTIQFCRYARMVAGLGARVILEVQEPLLGVMKSLEGVSELVSNRTEHRQFDYHTPLMSLPLAFQTTVNTVPAAPHYLLADANQVAEWAMRIGERRGLKVGLVWSGGYRPNRPELRAVNQRRNIPLSRFAVLRDIDVEFFSLQKGQPAEAELVELEDKGWNGPAIANVASDLRDFSDTAALIQNLDLVISVDTSVAHLAAALGKQIWLLNRFDSCWRWLEGRDDNPWYPTMKIYRQARHGDWEGVIERVFADLVQLRHCTTSGSFRRNVSVP